MSKYLGEVTKEEAYAVRLLFSRKQALAELLQSIDLKQNEELYYQIIEDLTTTGLRISDWWKAISGKYNWEFSSDDSWKLDFDSLSVRLN